MGVTPPTVLITGATSGLGLALAKHYRQHSARLVLIGRRPPEELDPELFSAMRYCRTYLSEPHAADDIERFLSEQGVEHVDLLIHNAGVGYFVPLEQQSAANLRNMVDINLRAPLALTHHLLPQSITRTWLKRCAST